MKQKRQRPRVGDVFEIRVPGGLAYVQYTHSVPRFGALIRVLPGIFEQRMNDMTELVAQKERFFVFFPVGVAVAQGIIEAIGNEKIPEDAQQFPLFKAAGERDQQTGRVLDWWLWDGEREWPVTRLTAAEKKLPIRTVLNDTALIHRIASGWHPEDEVTS